MTSLKMKFHGNKQAIKKFPIKEKVAAWRISLQEEIQKRKHKGFFNKIIPIIFVPLNALLKWMDNLSPAQAVLLIVFTVASFFSSFLVFESSKKIALFEEAGKRSPASIEDEKVQRPYYYKRQTRDFTIMAINIPVYFADLNEYRSVIVDFSIILTNRSSKNYLAKQEQILRDHIIMNVEPTIAAFNLQTEGKEIIRQKIKVEVSEFLKENNVEGDVEEVKITYILAN